MDVPDDDEPLDLPLVPNAAEKLVQTQDLSNSRDPPAVRCKKKDAPEDGSESKWKGIPGWGAPSVRPVLQWEGTSVCEAAPASSSASAPFLANECGARCPKCEKSGAAAAQESAGNMYGSVCWRRSALR